MTPASQKEIYDCLSLPFLFNNDITPPLSVQEIYDFAITPHNDEMKAHAESLERSERYLAAVKYFDELRKIPKDLSKKQYETMLKEAKVEINRLKMTIREEKNKMHETAFLDLRMADAIFKEELLKKKIKSFSMRFDGPDRLAQAKQVPLDSIIDFKGGFAKCPMHNERTASMKYYQKDNRFHCFSCGADGDSVDLVMKMQSITLPKAVEFLLKT